MALLKSIIKHLETEFSLSIIQNLDEDVRIENVQYLLTDTAASITYEDLTLYVGDYARFTHASSDGFFLLFNVPAGLSALPNCLLITQAIDPFAFCNSIQNTLFASHQANMRKEEMFHILQAGYGIQAILDTAHLILENPITMCTSSFSVLAISPKADSHETMEYIDGKYYFKRQAIKNMHENKVMEHLYSSASPFIATFADSPGIDFLFCGVRIQRAVVGYLCIRAVVRPLTKEDFAFLSDVAKMISIEMQKDNFYNHQTGLAYEYFLRDLLKQNIESADFAFHRMEQLGRPADSYFWILTFAFAEDTGRKLNSKYYIDQLISIFRHGISCFYNGNLILLLTSKYPVPFKGIDLAKFYHFIQLNQLRAAISYRYDQILQTHLYYQQTLFQLRNPHFSVTEPLSLYDEHYHNHLFHMVQNHTILKSLVHPDILFLLDYDLENNTDYIETLRTYFKNNRNALKTSQELHIHKSTFFYRLGKIETLTSFQIEDSALLFAYEFSFYLLNYLKTSH